LNSVLRSKILQQSGKTLKKAKSKLEIKVKRYCARGWKCSGDLSIKLIDDHYTGETSFEVYQKMVK